MSRPGLGCGLGGGLRQEDERRGKAAFVFMEMVLGDPGRIEAKTLGMDDLRGRQPVALGGVRLIQQAREEAQALRLLRCRHPLNLVLMGIVAFGVLEDHLDQAATDLPAIVSDRDSVRDLPDHRKG